MKSFRDLNIIVQLNQALHKNSNYGLALNSRMRSPAGGVQSAAMLPGVFLLRAEQPRDFRSLSVSYKHGSFEPTTTKMSPGSGLLPPTVKFAYRKRSERSRYFRFLSI